jgi:hypothetical protein
MDKDRPPTLLYLLTGLGAVLSIWLILYGMQLRFFGGFLWSEGLLAIIAPDNFLQLFGKLGGNAGLGELGWPLVVIGCSLAASLTGLWKRQRWSIPSLTLFGAFSLITLHWINLLSVLILLLARNHAIQGWLAPDDVIQG